MKAKMGQIVYYYLGEGEHQRAYVAIILKVIDSQTGRCFLRVINEGKGDTVTDFNQEADYSETPKSLHWSYPTTEEIEDPVPDTGGEEVS